MSRPRQKPWHQLPEVVERVQAVWELYMDGMGPFAIAKEKQVGLTTVKRDIQRARNLMAALAGQNVEAKRMAAVAKRESFQAAALKDREKADGNDASGRASLLREARENQSGIEELDGLRTRATGAAAGIRLRAGPGGIEVEAGVTDGRDLTQDILADDEATEASHRLFERVGRGKAEPRRPGVDGEREALDSD